MSAFCVTTVENESVEPESVQKQWAFSFCEVVKIDHNFITIKDNNRSCLFLIEQIGQRNENYIEKGDKISFLGKVVGGAENGSVIVHVVENFYNHRYNNLKKIISIPPVLVILFFLFKNRKKYF